MRKGSTICHESPRRLTEILPVAAQNLLYHRLQVFKKYLKTLDDPAGNEFVELRVRTEGTLEERRNKISREHTVCFQYAINESYYIALTIHSFQDILWEWYGGVHDCYLLNSKSLDDLFTTFDVIMPLSTLHKSDKENSACDETVSGPNSADKQIVALADNIKSSDKCESFQLGMI